jgi:GAF domain-containing protein
MVHAAPSPVLETGSYAFEEILSDGLAQFDLQFGVISRITGPVYRVVAAISPDDVLVPGDEFELENTYCVHCMQASGVTHYHAAGTSEIAQHPCYRVFALESYIGVKLFAGGHVFGTLNFSSIETRRPFGDADIAAMERLAARVEALI